MVLKNRGNEIRSNEIRIRRELPVPNTNEMASSLFLKRVREVKETHFVKISFGFVVFYH